MDFGRHLKRHKRCRRLHRVHRQMTEGESYRIIGYKGLNCHFRKKLLNLGLLRGEEFHVMGRAPMGDPIEIKINGYRLSLRAVEAEELILEKIDEKK
jgi:ferrous iron transport protein A